VAFLDQFLDAGVDVEPGNWTAQQETETAKLRLVQELVTVRHTMNMKRRLGGDASAAELSADKKIAKSVYNRLLTIYETWGGEREDIDRAYSLATGETEAQEVDGDWSRMDWAELLVEGAQIDWDAFWEAKKWYLKQQVRLMAGNAIANNDRKNGNRLANRYTNEYNSLGDVLDVMTGLERENKFEEI